MLDIGGWEFLIVAFVLVMVVGQKELPKMLRIHQHHANRRAANEFTSGMTDLANEADMADLKRHLIRQNLEILTKLPMPLIPQAGLVRRLTA